MNRRLSFYLGGAAFLFLAGMALVLTLALSRHFFPPRPEDAFGMGWSQGQSPRSWWERLRESFRHLPQDRAAGRRRAVRPHDSEAGDPGRLSGSARSMRPEHLTLREAAEAQAVRTFQYGDALDDAFETVRAVPVQGPFVQFERERFASRIFLQRWYQDDRSDADLRRFSEAIDKAVSRPEADFEDFFVAALAALNEGDARRSLKWAAEAESRWPSLGRGYGELYLVTMLAHAANGDSREVIRRLGDFREVYPDWLYVETYMTEVASVRRKFPGEPLLDVVRGRLLSFVNNYSQAEDAFAAALGSPRLDGVAAGQTQRWLDEIRKEVPR